jgi:dipeptidyl aminopeptidase/acylaminoacyl peptidase
MTKSTQQSWTALLGLLALSLAAPQATEVDTSARATATASQQQPPTTAAPQQPQGRGEGRGARGGGRGRPDVPMDPDRARLLYVSNKPEDLPTCNCERDIASQKQIDATYLERSKGLMDYAKIHYTSPVDGLEIQAHLFSPLQKRGARGHAAMVWVHGGVHGSWGTNMFPFVREAVQRGYVIIAPDYRGSTGYGEEFYKKIDYGGREIDDVVAAFDYLKTLPYVDTDRVGIMGWSHGGFITSHVLFREQHPFKAGAAIVPVTNLVFRLSYKGPGYQRDYAPEETIQGLPFEKRDEYIARSPVFHVNNLKVPMLCHVATNDLDVNFVEDQQMIYTLQALKPKLAETKIYVDPTPGPVSGGHTFSRRVNPETLERDDSPAQIDSWNLTWAFFERNLNPKASGKK